MKPTGSGVERDQVLRELTIDVGEAVLNMKARYLPSMRPYYLDWVKEAENIGLCGPEYMPKSRTLVVTMPRSFMSKNGGPTTRKFSTKSFGVLIAPHDSLPIAASNVCGYGKMLRGALHFDEHARNKTLEATEKRIYFLVNALDGNPRATDMADDNGGASLAFKKSRLQVLLYLMRCHELLRQGRYVPSYVETLKLGFDRARWLRDTKTLPEFIDLELHDPGIW